MIRPKGDYSMAKATKRDVAAWLTRVASRLPATISVDEVKGRIAAAAPLLQSKLPAAAFCSTTEDLVVASHKFHTWPTEGEIIAALEAWWRENDPNAPHKIPDWIAQSPLDLKGQIWINAWDRSRTVAGLDFLRLHHSAAYIWLIQNDTEAAGIAVQRRWLPLSMADMQASWDDPDLTVQVVERILAPMPDGSIWTGAASALAMMRQALARHAPQHLHLVPDDIPMQGEIIPPSVGLFEG
jgi:hypothetical protein